MSTSLVNVSQQKDFLARAIRTPLYDKSQYPILGTLNLAFFAIPNGQAGKTYADTNLIQGGKVGGGQRFYMEGFQFSPEQRTGALTADYLTIRNDWARITGIESGAVIAAAQNAAGLFRFGIGSVTSLLTVPIALIPSGIRASADAAYAAVALANSAMQYVGNGLADNDEMFEFKMVTVNDDNPEEPIIVKRRWQLLADETFNCSLEYHQGLVPLAATALNLIVTIPGILVKAL